jgi:hypothetical protein
MPIERYFQGAGRKIMESMRKKYGDRKGEQVFYATAEKRKMKPVDSKIRKSMRSAMRGRGKHDKS